MLVRRKGYLQILSESNLLEDYYGHVERYKEA
jgi:hypothetical protein